MMGCRMIKSTDKYKNTGAIHTDPENDRFLPEHEPIKGNIRSRLFWAILENIENKRVGD